MPINPRGHMPSFYVLDVKHGNCSILFDKDVTTIIDAGPGMHLVDFLEKRNTKHVDTILISHADKDHVGGLIALLSSEIKIDEIYINPDSTKDNLLYDDLVTILYNKDKKKQINYSPYLSTDINDRIKKGEINIEILSPNKYLIGKGVGNIDKHHGRTITSNSISAIIKISLDSDSLILLPGDVDEVGLDNLIDDKVNISAHISIFPHHGGRVGSSNTEQFTTKFCENINSQHIVFSIRKNEGLYPRIEVLETIAKILPETILYTTNFSGTLEQHNDASKEHKNDVGTISIDLKSPPLNFKFERNV